MRILTILAALILSVSVSAQCFPDRHNTTWFDAWVSCETSVGPISAHGESHWIQYDFGEVYLLGEMEIWNINDPAHLDRGAQTIHIDVSIDGINWTALADQTLQQATGLSTYEGQTLMDFEEEEVRFLVITIADTYGASCGGFSELKIGVEGVVTDINEFLTPDACFEVLVYPNPHQDLFNARISSKCGGSMQIELHDAMGRLVYTEQTVVQEQKTFTLGNADLPAGVYYLNVQQDGALGRYQIVKTQ